MVDTAKRKEPSQKGAIFKMVVPQMKVVDADNGRIEAIVSSESEDRDGDVITAKGWVLDYFLKHPVLIANHDYRNLNNQIGEWEEMSVKGKKLVGVAKYYIGMGNEQADWGYKIAKLGKAAYSVGFIPLEWEERDVDEVERPSWWGGYKFTKQELLEVSHVTVPSNPDALQLIAGTKGLLPEIKMVAKGIIKDIYSEEEAKELLTDRQKKDSDKCSCYAPGCEGSASVSYPLCPKHLSEVVMALSEDTEDSDGSDKKYIVIRNNFKSATLLEPKEEEDMDRDELKSVVKEAFIELLAENNIKLDSIDTESTEEKDGDAVAEDKSVDEIETKGEEEDANSDDSSESGDEEAESNDDDTDDDNSDGDEDSDEDDERDNTKGVDTSDNDDSDTEEKKEKLLKELSDDIISKSFMAFVS